MRLRIAILLVTFLLTASALAEPATHPAVIVRTTPEATAEFGIDFWREAEGLSQSRIRCITQTKDGYLWLGTDSGLVRFNGSSFTAFTVETGSLRDNEVWGLQEDNEGGLWIGTYGGGLTLFKNGQFRTYTTGDGVPDDVVRRLSKERGGNIWLTTLNGAARLTHGVFTQFTTADGLIDNSATILCADSSQGVLVVAGGTLHRFVNGRFESLRGLISTSDGPISHLLSGRDGAIWLGFHEA